MKKQSGGVALPLIAVLPLLLGLCLLLIEKVFTPGDCKSIGGVMCWSHAIMIFGTMISVPVALVFGLLVSAVTVIVDKSLKSEKSHE